MCSTRSVRMTGAARDRTPASTPSASRPTARRSTPGTTGPRRPCTWRRIVPHALRQAISACRKGGTVSIPGVYGGWLDKFPLGAAFAQGADPEDGPDPHAPVHARRCSSGSSAARSIPSFIITHRVRPRRSAGDVSHLPRQRGLVHQGRHAASGDDVMSRKFAIVTGASSGIGYELALICAEGGIRPGHRC